MAAGRVPKLVELGELERAVLELLWMVGDLDVNEVHLRIGAKRGISPNTVGSALERLYRKGLARRTRVSHAYRYEATCTREEYLGQQMASALGSLRRLAGTGLIASFIDTVVNTDEDTLTELEELIARKRKEAS